MAKFVCTICGYVYEGLTAPQKCLVCKAPASDFSEIEESPTTENKPTEAIVIDEVRDVIETGGDKTGRSFNESNKEQLPPNRGVKSTSVKNNKQHKNSDAVVNDTDKMEVDIEAFTSSFKDLVIQTLTNGADIKGKAEGGDATACFQMGMVHLLGINMPIDFKKASRYLGNQSLKDNEDANRLLGFIAEYEGNYSQAFKQYVSSNGNTKSPYLTKVLDGRNQFKAYLKKIGLPEMVLNKEITDLLKEYNRAGNDKIDISIKLAMICEDEESCLDVAQLLYNEGDYYSAMRWLQSGKVSESNSLYVSIKKKLSDSRSEQNLPDVLEVMELDGNSFLTDSNEVPSLEEIKTLCDEAATQGKKYWRDAVSPITKKIEEEAAARIKKQKEEEEARIRKQKEKEETARKIKKQQEEEAEQLREKEAERQAYLEKLPERRQKIYSRYKISFSIITAPVVLILLYFLFTVEGSFISKLITYSLVFVIFVLLPYFVIKWIIKKICKL